MKAYSSQQNTAFINPYPKHHNRGEQWNEACVWVRAHKGGRAKLGQRLVVRGETDLEVKTTCSRDREVSIPFPQWPLRAGKEDRDRSDHHRWVLMMPQMFYFTKQCQGVYFRVSKWVIACPVRSYLWILQKRHSSQLFGGSYCEFSRDSSNIELFKVF